MEKVTAASGAAAGSNLAKIGAVAATGVLAATAAVAGLAVGVATIGGIATKVAATFQQEMAVVAAVSRAPREELDKLVTTIQNVASTSVVSMHEAASAAGELARAGVSVDDQLQGALKAVTNLSIASAGELGLDKAARLVATALNAWQLPGSQAATVANAITVAAQKSAISFNDLMRSFQQVSPIAAALKIPIEDVSAALGVLGLAGLRGSDAGTSLKQMFIQLEKPSKQAAALMQEYGISLFNAEGGIRPLRDLIVDLSSKLGEEAVATGQITEAQRHHALAVLFGSDAIRAALVLSNLGVTAFDELRGSMDDSSFSAETLAKVMQAPLASQIKIVWNNVQNLLEALGRGLIPVFGEATAKVLTFMQSLDPNKLILVGQAVGVLASGQGFGALTKAITAATGATEQYDSVNEETGESITETRVRATALGSVLITLVNFFRNVGVAASLILAPLADIAKRIFGITDSADSLQSVIATINNLGKAIVQAAGVTGALISAFADVVGAGFSLIGTIANLIKNFLQIPVVAEMIKTALVALAVVGIAVLGIVIAKAIVAIVAFIAANALWIAALLLTVAIVRIVAIAFIQNWDAISQAVANAVSFISSVVGALVSFYGQAFSLLGTIIYTLPQFWFNAYAMVADVIDGLLQAVGMIPTGFGNALRRAAAIVASILNSIGQTIASFVNQIAEMPLIGEAIGGVGAFFSGLGSGINIVADSVGEFTGKVQRMTAAVPAAMSTLDNLTGSLKTLDFSAGALGGAGGSIPQLGDAASSAGPPLSGLGGAGDKAGKGAKGAADAIEKELIPAIDGFIQKLAELARMRSFIDAFGELGAEAVDALITAVVENTDKAGAQVAEALHKFTNDLRREEIPDWEELGFGLGSAFEIALVERTDEAIQAAIDVVKTVVDRLKASGALSPENFSAAFDKAGIKAKLGSDGASFMDAMRDAIIDGGKKNIEAMADSALKMFTEFTKNLTPEKAKAHIDSIMEAITRGIEEGTPEATAAVSALIQEINLDVQLDEILTNAAQIVKDKDREIAELFQDSEMEKYVKSMREGIEKEIDAALEKLKAFQKTELKFEKDRTDSQDRMRDKQRSQQDLQRDRSREDQDIQRDRALEDRERHEENIGKLRAQQIKINNKLAMGATAEEEIIELAAIQNAINEETKGIVEKRKREEADRQYKRQREDEDRQYKEQREEQDRKHSEMREIQQEQLRETLEQRFNHAKEAHSRRLADFDKTMEDLAFKQKIANIEAETKKKMKELEAEENKIKAIAALASSMFDGAISDIQTIEEVSDHALDEMMHESEEILNNVRQTAQELAHMGGNIGLPSFQHGGIVPGVGPQIIQAHGGEVVRNLASIGAREAMGHPSINNIVNQSYTVNANYAHVQSEANVGMDMRALIAMSSK